MKKIVEFAHDLLRSTSKAKVAIDFTLGNGNDLLVMEQMEHVEVLYGFDIQQLAINHSKEKIMSEKEVHFICDGHEHFDKYVTNYDLGIFNLGYFPSGDQSITTMCDTTLIAINKALKYLNKKGMLVLVCYVGHEEGKKEASLIDDLVCNLDAHYFQVVKIQMMSSTKAPYIYGISKVR